MGSDKFRRAVESRDLNALEAALAPDVVFRSPVVFKPYEGREAVMVLLRHVLEVFEDFHYLDEVSGEGRVALIFEARVGDRELQGLDYLRLDDDGRVAELTVMVRPLSGALALRDAMGARLAAAG